MTKPIDRNEFLKVLEANKGIIYKVSRAYCKLEEDRKDLMQEIVIQIWNSFHTYNYQYKHSTWIYRIALNVAISLYRKKSVRQSKFILLSDTAIFIDEGQANEKEGDIVLLYQVIHELNNLDKALILLYLEQNSYKEIAEIIDLTETNVATKIGRVKKIIKQKFLAIKNN